MDTPRRARIAVAFTLIEIAVALALVAGTALTAILALPVGLRAQQMDRFRIYAGTVMTTIANQLAEQQIYIGRTTTESARLGQSPFTRGTTNIEQILGSRVPDVIAARFDSDGDEIQRLLGAGGKLFYLTTYTGFDAQTAWSGWTARDRTQPAESARIVVGVVGYPQQDALINHPCLNWPVFEMYPSPPTLQIGPPENPLERFVEDECLWADNVGAWGGAEAYARMRAVCAASRDACDHPADLARAAAYLDACRQLVATLAIPTSASPGGEVPIPPTPLPAGPWPASARSDPDVFPPPQRILALRWLAHAAALRTAKALPAASPDEVAYARACHEACLRWAQRYARADPYDWGAPRIMQANCGCDYPLLQFDLFSDPVTIHDGGGDPDRSWLVVAAAAVTNRGHARNHYGWQSGGLGNPYPDRIVPANGGEIDASWGDRRHFTLTNRFAAAERCRQIVFWSVDWQSYEDFETAPSTPFDAKLHNFDSDGAYLANQLLNMSPERTIVWADAARRAPAGYDGSSDPGDMHTKPLQTVGFYGADRNGNGVCDVGPVPRSVRMRAATVARYNVYDKRIPVLVR